MQSIDSTKTHVYGSKKDVRHVKEEIKRYNIIRKCLTSITFQKKEHKRT